MAKAVVTFEWRIVCCGAGSQPGYVTNEKKRIQAKNSRQPRLVNSPIWLTRRSAGMLSRFFSNSRSPTRTSLHSTRRNFPRLPCSRSRTRVGDALAFASALCRVTSCNDTAGGVGKRVRCKMFSGTGTIVHRTINIRSHIVGSLGIWQKTHYIHTQT